MSEAVYPIVFWSGMALLVSVIIAGFFYIVGHDQGIREQKEAEATARAALHSKPGDLTPCRDPQAVAEALRNLRSQDYASPRNEIALTMLSLHYNDQEDAETNVANFFLIADEFIKQADGREG